MSIINEVGPTVGQQTLRALLRYPDRLAFVWDGGTLTYRGAAELIGRFQAVYLQHRLGRGRCVALLSGNRAHAWCAAVAAHACGMATTWLHPMGAFQDQLFQLADSGAAALIVDPIQHALRGGELAASAKDLLAVFSLGAADFATDLIFAADTIGHAQARDLAEPRDIATLNYTGGTTGRSKGVLRRHPSVTAMAVAVLSDFELPEGPRYLPVAPISHVAGTKVLPTLMRGGTIHLLSDLAPERVLAYIERERINFVLSVPTWIYALLDTPALGQADLSSLELFMYGASPMSPTRLLEGLDRIGPVFSQLYGQTECYPATVLRRADHNPSDPGLFSSCGHPVSSCAVRLLDDAGFEVAPGEPGEICLRGPSAMEEYWRQPELTAEAFRDGWLHTGDIARQDDRGYLYIVDRKKDMIISGGFNVYPREVEDVLTAHEAVSMAAVIGVPDERWGEAVTAVVVLRPGANIDEAGLIDYVKAQKGPVLAPKRIDFVRTLPMTGVGKIDKKALRAGFWAGRERMVG